MYLVLHWFHWKLICQAREETEEAAVKDKSTVEVQIPRLMKELEVTKAELESVKVTCVFTVRVYNLFI